jgi:hypothetical protein
MKSLFIWTACMTDPSHDPEPTAKPRGLWSVIGHSSEPIDAETHPSDQEEQSNGETQDSTAAPPQSLFAIMRRAESPDATLKESLPEAADGPALSESVPDPSTIIEAIDEPVKSFALDAGPRATTIAAARLHAKRLRQSSVALMCGIASVLLSALSIRPEFWMGFPASGLGFCAIILGYMTLTGGRLRDLPGYTKTVSQIGMMLGTLGLFLGPVVFAGIGREWRESMVNQQTRKHLKTIGEGLAQFHSKNGTFPVGGTFAKEKSGTFRGQHGWMTFLLPYINQQAVYEQIDLTKPFDAPENRKAMGTEIEDYYTDSGDRTKIGQDFAVSHFAGVGGDISNDSGLAHAGIFERDKAISAADVTDGLSHTLIVGELAGNYLPWGDPENWRTTGKGLNKDANGFGNVAGTGAMFLFGDGSVRSFSNKTDARLLRQLSTRDGGEAVP